MAPRDPVGSFAAAVDQLLRATHLNAPDQLPDIAARAARRLGATEAFLYLIDYEQVVLTPLPVGATVSSRPALSVDSTVAGRAFRTVEAVESDAGASRRLWIPLLDGVERLGILELVIAAEGRELTSVERSNCTQFAHMVAELLVSNSLYTDSYEWARRREPMTLAAEMQHWLLPPLTFGTNRVVISGLLAPAYEVGGDAYDYALNGNIAHVAMFDAVGHGLQASVLANMAVSCYRNCRRAGLDIAATALEIDTVIDTMFGSERYVTAILGQLDIDTGLLRWMNAGHPQPMLLRDSQVIKQLGCEPLLPLGLNAMAGKAADRITDHLVCQESLEPGDRILLLTDGVDEARTEDGEFFGRTRLAEFAARESASGLPTPEVMRRLQQAILRHQTGRLQDDATTLFVEWLTAQPDHLIPGDASS